MTERDPAAAGGPASPDGGRIRSMTGCGIGTAADERGTCRVELRCVNNRFFKFSLRAREGFSSLEARSEAVVRGRVRRGSVQMTLELGGGAAAARGVDRGQLGAYFEALEEFCAARGLPRPLGAELLLGLPGVIVEQVGDDGAAERWWPVVGRALAGALDALEAMRTAEGAALARDLRATCGEIRALVAAIADRAPALVDDQRRRLLERLRAVLDPRGMAATAADVVRETAVMAERCDISEELVRLGSHLDQFDHLLGGEAPGRPLDFLAQELAREANTIASKSPDAAIAQGVVEIKSRIERLREQVQNIE